MCGKKRYELSSHLGNVLAVVSDRKIRQYANGSVSYYVPDILSAQDYYAFGATLPNRRAALQQRNIYKFTVVDGNGNGALRELKVNIGWKTPPNYVNQTFCYKTNGNGCPSGTTTFNQMLAKFVAYYNTLAEFVKTEEFAKINRAEVLHFLIQEHDCGESQPVYYAFK